MARTGLFGMSRAFPVRRVFGMVVAAVAVVLMALAVFASPSWAVNRTWDGGGTTNDWSEAANWSGDTVPGVNDTAIFDGTSTKDATIDVPVTVSGFQINSGYTGTITQAPGVAVTTGTYTQSAGTFTGGGGDMDINGNFNLSGGTFTASSGTTFFAGQFASDPPGGTFNHNGGTVALDGNQSFDNRFNSTPFNNLTFNKTGGASVFLNSTVIVAGTLALSDGFAKNGTIEARGAVNVGPDFDGGNAALNLIGAADQTFTNSGGPNPTGAWTLNKPSGTVELESDLDLSNSSSLNLTEGTITTGSNKVNVGNRPVSRTDGHIIGNLQRGFTATGAKTFDVGTANGYSPVNVNVTTLTTNPSSLTVGTTQTTHPRLDPAISLARFWSITETGDLTATLTFNYLQTDVNGDEANYKVNRIAGENVEILTPSAATVDTNANAGTVTGVTDFSADWALGVAVEPLKISPTSVGANPGEQITFTATGGAAPYSFDLVTNDSGATMEPTTGVYTAGSTVGATDTVRVTDSNGSTADATVDVVDPFIVIDTDASGAGSLPRAVSNANATPGVQTISFDIPGAAPFTIRPTGVINVTDPVIIDGSTQPGFDGTPVIELDGSDAPATSSLIGLRITGGGSIVRSLAINRYRSPSSSAGIGISLSGSGGNTIEGSFIGTSADGTTALGNKVGIRVDSPGNTIGGTTAAARNVVSGNVERGIDIFDDDTTVRGNYIGAAADGVGPLGNGAGILMGTNAGNNSIGGTAPGAANVIAFNDSEVFASFGVTVNDDGGNAIRGNAIHSNGDLGIDLGTPGVTPNDACDADTGGNELQNFPAITSAGTVGDNVVIQGTLDSKPNQTFTIDFYASAAGDPSGNGEGRVYLGSTTAATGADCDASFDASLAAPVSGNDVITATATDSGGNTSEFSAAQALTDLSPFVVTNTDDAGEGSLRQAIINADSTPGTQTIRFDLSGTAPFTINIASRLNVEEPVIIDATTQPGYAGSPVVEIRPNGNDSIGLNIGNDTVVKGLAISDFVTAMVLCGSGNTVQGNYIGVDLTGNAGVGNDTGIFICGSSSDNLVGGQTPDERNVISRNNVGIALHSAAAIQGNFIGTDAAGTSDIDGFQSSTGIEVLGDAWTITDNVIGGNFHGIHIKRDPRFFSSLNINVVENNSIGLGADGTSLVGNTFGIRINDQTRQVRMTENRVFGNTGLGIFLDNGLQSGFTPLPNDPQDPDTGPNNQQNYPVLTSASSSGGSTTVAGTLDSTPSRDFTLEFFSSPSCDASGNGEGETFLGSTDVTTDAGGIADFTADLPVTVDRGRSITATATDSGGNTSEFSQCLAIPRNEKPQAQNGARSMNEDASPIEIDFGALVSDVETSDANLTYDIVSGPTAQQGTLTGTGPTRAFTPAADFNGTVEIDYTATDRGDPDNCGAPGPGCDGPLTSDQKTVTITVESVNDAPVAEDDQYKTKQNKKLTVRAPGVLENDRDIDGGSLTASGVSGPRNGKLALRPDGSFVYTPKKGFKKGTDTFTYEVSDGKGGADTAKVTIKVRPKRR
ncbi:MAG: Ig-like domain-containing protein [Rubrobacteraceae bacterium]